MATQGRRRRGLLTVRTSVGKVGRNRYVLRWIKGQPYVYLREYLGAAGHSRARTRDVYLGRVSVELARHGTQQQLSAAAYRLRRKRAVQARGN